LSLASSLTIDMVGLLDEIDAFTDAQFKDSYILMLSEIMTTLNIEQMFIISHNITPGQYENVVHVLNITGEDN
jgi:chromosome segregation ATPase